MGTRAIDELKLAEGGRIRPLPGSSRLVASRPTRRRRTSTSPRPRRRRPRQAAWGRAAVKAWSLSCTGALKVLPLLREAAANTFWVPGTRRMSSCTAGTRYATERPKPRSVRTAIHGRFVMCWTDSFPSAVGVDQVFPESPVVTTELPVGRTSGSVPAKRPLCDGSAATKTPSPPGTPVVTTWRLQCAPASVLVWNTTHGQVLPGAALEMYVPARTPRAAAMLPSPVWGYVAQVTS